MLESEKIIKSIIQILERSNKSVSINQLFRELIRAKVIINK